MKIVPLSAIPNQSFVVRLGASFYTIAIKETNGVMSANIARDNITLLSGARIVAGTPLIPYQYLARENGNFFLLTQDNQLPYYAEFSIKQILVYLSAEEIDDAT